MLFQNRLTSVLDTAMGEILFPRICDLEAIELLWLTVNDTLTINSIRAVCVKVSGLEDGKFTQN